MSESVIERASAGDAAAVEALVASLAPRVRSMVGARLGADPHTREDVAQDVLLAIAKGLPQLRDRSVQGLRGYVSGVVRRKIADCLRCRSAGVASGVSRIIQVLTAGLGSPASAIAHQELASLVVEEIGHMRERDRLALQLAFFDGLNTTEIGRALGIERTAAAMVLTRALAALRERWRLRWGGR